MTTDEMCTALVHEVLPQLVSKLKEDRDMIATLQSQLDTVEKARQALADMLKEDEAKIAALQEDMKTLYADLAFERQCREDEKTVRSTLADEVQQLTVKVKELSERSIAPATVTRKRTRRKKNLPIPEGGISPLDILRANYALATTKGDVDWASALSRLPQDKVAYIENMTSAEIDEIYNPDLLTDEPSIDIRYAQTNWRELPEDLRGARRD